MLAANTAYFARLVQGETCCPNRLSRPPAVLTRIGPTAGPFHGGLPPGGEPIQERTCINLH